MPQIIIGAVLAQIATGGSTSHLHRRTTVLCQRGHISILTVLRVVWGSYLMLQPKNCYLLG